MFKNIKHGSIALLRVFKKLSRLTIMLYVFACAFIFIVGDCYRAWDHVITSTLSRYMPSYDYLIKFDHDRRTFDLKKMQEFERYYRKVVEFMPLLPEAHAMLGFCYFYNGESVKAAKAYESAIRLYPKVFNFHYNLGIIALKKDDYVKVLTHFKNSIEIPPLENISFIVATRMYQPFLPFARQPDTLALAMGERTQETYRSAYVQLLRAAENVEDYKSMLLYARQGVARGFLDKATAYYFMGVASYQLREYENAVGFLQESITNNFQYAQAFQILALCLQALNRPESKSAFIAASSLRQDGKIFEVKEPELLIY
ncbi:MAG: tetratricopeptide repeat protein [Candidatus Omnitrophica bacterium]|nr:tetratricopeptide repeat protein [Candidatus Omnitrophota bacterium]